MNREYQSSITRGGPVLTPEKIIITATSVTWKKRNSILIGMDSIVLPINKISGITINEKIIGADIEIGSFGQERIVAKNFDKNDAIEIKQLLMSRINKEANEK